MFTNDTTDTDNTATASVATTPDPASTTVAHRADINARPARPPRRWVRRGALIAGVALAVSGIVVLTDLVTNESAITTSRFDEHIERLHLTWRTATSRSPEPTNRKSRSRSPPTAGSERPGEGDVVVVLEVPGDGDRAGVEALVGE